MKNNEASQTIELKNGVNEYQYYYDEIDLGEMECISDDDLLGNSRIFNSFISDNIMDLFWDAEQRLMNSNTMYKDYTDYEEFIHDLYDPMDEYCTEFRLRDGSFLIYKRNDALCYHYTVYDTILRDERIESLEVGDCIDPDDVPKIVQHYLKTGECGGHM